MKYVLSAVLVFMIASGLSYAQTDEPPIKPDMSDKVQKKAFKKEHHRGKRSKKYSGMLNSLVVRASSFASDEDQEAELIGIRDKYVFSLVEKENEYYKANSQILKSLSNADFDASEINKEFKKTQTLQEAIFNEYMEGLSALKKVIGDDNYNSLFTMTRDKGKKPKGDGEKKKDQEGSKKEPEKKPAEESTSTE